MLNLNDSNFKAYIEAEKMIRENKALRELVDNLVWWGSKYVLNLHKDNPTKIIKKVWIDEFTDCNLGLREVDELTIKPSKFI